MPDLDGADKWQAEKISEALQHTAGVDFADAPILVRWVVVADWCGPDGKRSLTRAHSDGATIWEAEGLLRAGLDWDWDDDA
jgi:hypothetical protein